MMSLTDREEDYLRILYEVINDKGYAKVKDVSLSLDITPASVVGMMKKLSEKGLINYRKYESITLTEIGNTHAEAVSRRHETFKELLQIIGVPRDIAEQDAHILEHHLHVDTINRFSRLVDVIKRHQKHSNHSLSYLEIIPEMMKK